jgi:hypothetical protein
MQPNNDKEHKITLEITSAPKEIKQRNREWSEGSSCGRVIWLRPT